MNQTDRAHLGRSTHEPPEPVPEQDRRLRADARCSDPLAPHRHDRRAHRARGDPLVLLFNKTKVGLAMRAVANNQESSNLVGIRVGRILVLGWGLPVRSPSWRRPARADRRSHRLADARTVPAGVGGRRARWARLARRRRGRRSRSSGSSKRSSVGYTVDRSVELTPDLLYPVMLVILLGVLLFRPPDCSAPRKWSVCDGASFKVARGSWQHWAGRSGPVRRRRRCSSASRRRSGVDRARVCSPTR